MRLLEVGDTIYFDVGYSLLRSKVERVTPKFAFTKNRYKLKREVHDDGRIDRSERIGYDLTTIYLASAELNERFLDQQYHYFLTNGVNWEEVPIEVKKHVYELVKDYNKKE